MTTFTHFQARTDTKILIDRPTFSETKKLLEQYRKYDNQSPAAMYGVTDKGKIFKLHE